MRGGDVRNQLLKLFKTLLRLFFNFPEAFLNFAEVFLKLCWSFLKLCWGFFQLSWGCCLCQIEWNWCPASSQPPVVNFRPDFAVKVKSWLITLMFPIFANFWIGAMSLWQNGSTKYQPWQWINQDLLLETSKPTQDIIVDHHHHHCHEHHFGYNDDDDYDGDHDCFVLSEMEFARAGK